MIFLTRFIKPLLPEITPFLIRGLKDREEQAWAALYDLYAPALYGIILKNASPEMSIEALAKVFHHLYTHIDHYHPPKERLFTWIYKEALHVCAAIKLERLQPVPKGRKM